MVAVILGFGFDNTFLSNIATFFVWVTFLMGMLLLIPEVRKAMIEDAKTTGWISPDADLALDIIMLIIFIGFGSWFLGTLYIVSNLILNDFQRKVHEKIEKEQKEKTDE